MGLNAVLVPLGEALQRYRRLALPLIVLLAYAAAVPPEETFGSEGLEHVKDLLAFSFAFLGLTFRGLLVAALYPPVAAGSGPDLGISRSPLYLANLTILFAIFLMHGDFYVVTFGAVACLIIYLAVVRAEENAALSAVAKTRPAPVPLRAAFTSARSQIAAIAAREWPTAASVLALLLLTEVYEHMPEDAAASLKAVLLAMSGLLAAVSAVVLLTRTRAVSEPGATKSPTRTGPQTRGIRVDQRVRSLDIFENVLSLGHLEPILRATLDAAALRPGDRLVDVGCGTGKLAVCAARLLPGAREGDVLGIDATPGMIDLARERALQEGSAASFHVGVGEALPLPDGWVEAVTSSYFLHHLPPDVKRQAIREMWRVLKPGGRLVITDYGRPRSFVGWLASFPMRFNFYEYVRPQLRGELERLIAAERLGSPEVMRVFLGYITVLRLVKPAGAPCAPESSWLA